jgi:hypothetical protein
MRVWTRGLFVDLAREAGAADPNQLGLRLVLLYDGATVGAAMDRNSGAVAEARAVAELLLDTHAPASHPAKHGGSPSTKAKAAARKSGRVPLRP